MPKYEPNWDTYRPAAEGECLSQKAADVLSYGIDSVQSFYDLFEKSRKDRGATGGYTTHAEQDLLRSMIVFGAATLDSVIKQTLRDCLSHVTAQNADAKRELEKFVDRRLRMTEGEAAINVPLVRQALLSARTDEFLLEEYVRELTGSSLQSAEEVRKAASALAIDLRLGKEEARHLKEVFDARNEIIHELDYLHSKTKKKQRNRHNRNRKKCLEQTERLLGIAKQFVEGVENNV